MGLYTSKEIPTSYTQGNRIYDLRERNDEKRYLLYKVTFKGRPKDDCIYELWRIRYTPNKGYFYIPLHDDDMYKCRWIGDIPYLREVLKQNFK